MFDLSDMICGIVSKITYKRLAYGKIVSKREAMHTVANTYKIGRPKLKKSMQK